MNKKKLILDIGNTQTKLAFFCDDEIQDYFKLSDEKLFDTLSKFVDYTIIISSVRNSNFTNKVANHCHSALLLNSKTLVPIKNKYATPETLGNDRLANAVAAMSLFPSENCLIVDAGTCLKFDFVDNEGAYHGGSISPGLHMRFSALHTFTDNLPLINDVEQESFIGNSTLTSMKAGVLKGMMAEMNGMIAMYQEKFGMIKIILTGGDSETLLKLAGSQKNSIFADEFLTLKGLNQILKYNEGM